VTGLTLADFAPRKIFVNITDLAGAVILTVPLASLSWSEYHEIGQSIADPVPPTKRDFVNDKMIDVADLKDAGYQAALGDVIGERNRRRLAVALIRAGNLPELATASIEERAAAIEGMDVIIVSALIRAMNDLLLGARAKLAAQADSFQRVSADGAAGVPANGLVVGAVASAE